MKIIKEITEDKPFLIVFKPSGIPSAPLSENDTNNIFFQVAQKYPQVLNVIGRKKIEHGLIHRLDTVTSGLIIIAATQDSYEELIELQKQNKIKKYYKAICEYKPEILQKLKGFPPQIEKYSTLKKEYLLKSYFRHYGIGRKEVRPVCENCGKQILKKVEQKKIYSTKIKILSENEQKIQVETCITNGFKHQIRSHLAWLGLPIISDPVYNISKEKNKTEMNFCAYKIDICGDIWYI